jgi:hypothetical protein
MPEMLHYYSLVVIAPYEIPLPQHLTILEEGFNVLSLTVQKIEPLCEALLKEGCTIVQCNRLDVSEPVSLPLVLEVGEPRSSDVEKSP